MAISVRSILTAPAFKTALTLIAKRVFLTCMSMIPFVSSTQVALANDAPVDWYCGPQTVESNVRWIDTALGKQKLVIVRPDEPISKPTLIVFLHGDSPFGDPVYQYELAKEMVASLQNTVAVSVLRPGYSDSCGERSEGLDSRKMGDNYTTDVVDSLASMISDVQIGIAPSRTIVIGHSGGAALAALLAARHSELQDKSILVACPCDLPKWRESMKALMDNPGWLDPMPGLSPVEEISNLDPSKRIDLWVGDQDKITPPFLTIEFSTQANKSGKNTAYTIVAGGDHDMILRPEILRRILQEIET